MPATSEAYLNGPEVDPRQNRGRFLLRSVRLSLLTSEEQRHLHPQWLTELGGLPFLEPYTWLHPETPNNA